MLPVRGPARLCMLMPHAVTHVPHDVAGHTGPAMNACMHATERLYGTMARRPVVPHCRG